MSHKNNTPLHSLASKFWGKLGIFATLLITTFYHKHKTVLEKKIVKLFNSEVFWFLKKHYILNISAIYSAIVLACVFQHINKAKH